MVDFDLGRVEDGQKECKLGPHAEKGLDMDYESVGGEDGVSHAVHGLVQALRGWGLERGHQHHPRPDDRFPLVCMDNGYLSGDATGVIILKKDIVEVARTLPQEMEQVGGFLPHQIMEEIWKVVRHERFSEHIEIVKVRRWILKENVEVVSLALHGQSAEKILGQFVEVHFHKSTRSLSRVFCMCNYLGFWVRTLR